MKSSRIMKIFEQYVRKYDMNNVNIKSRYFHCLKVMEIAKELATGLGIFNEEEIAAIELASLFHEIGNFSKTPDYRINEVDDEVTEKSLDILFNKDLIRDITKETTYDDAIKMAIYACDKNGFPRNIDEKTRHICAIIKDAHNLDSFRLFVNYPYVDTRINSYPNSTVYNEFKKFKTINNKVCENNADSVLALLSKMYSFNYKYSYYLLKQNDYVAKLFDMLTFENDECMNFFKQLTNVLNNYIDKRIGAVYAR